MKQMLNQKADMDSEEKDDNTFGNKTHYNKTHGSYMNSGDDDEAFGNKTHGNKTQGSSKDNSEQRVQGPHRVKRRRERLKVQFNPKASNSRASKDVQECSESATPPAKARERD